MNSENKVGRPRKFDTPKQMQKAIDEYFEKCDSRTRQVYVKSRQELVNINDPAPYTIEGLCHELEIDRSTLLRYEDYEDEVGYKEFCNTIKKAKMRVQENLVRRALSGENNATISIFLLKNNFKYEDRTEIGVDSYEIEF